MADFESIVFLPALPARGATHHPIRAKIAIYISTRAPREGSDRHPRPLAGYYPISTRAPREGSDLYGPSLFIRSMDISTRAPREGSDGVLLDEVALMPISTRAPREGSDKAFCWRFPCLCNFYPRSPRGERHLYEDFQLVDMEFLPALPARGATPIQ